MQAGSGLHGRRGRETPRRKAVVELGPSSSSHFLRPHINRPDPFVLFPPETAHTRPDTLMDREGTEQGKQHYPKLKSKMEGDEGKEVKVDSPVVQRRVDER